MAKTVDLCIGKNLQSSFGQFLFGATFAFLAGPLLDLGFLLFGFPRRLGFSFGGSDGVTPAESLQFANGRFGNDGIGITGQFRQHSGGGGRETGNRRDAHDARGTGLRDPGETAFFIKKRQRHALNGRKRRSLGNLKSRARIRSQPDRRLGKTLVVGEAQVEDAAVVENVREHSVGRNTVGIRLEHRNNTLLVSATAEIRFRFETRPRLGHQLHIACCAEQVQKPLLCGIGLKIPFLHSIKGEGRRQIV